MKVSAIIIFIFLLFLGSCETEYIPQCKGEIIPEIIVLETTYGITLNVKNTGTSKMTYASIECRIKFSSRTETRNAYCDSLNLKPGNSIVKQAKIYPTSDGDKYWIRYDKVYDGRIIDFDYPKLRPMFECDY